MKKIISIIKNNKWLFLGFVLLIVTGIIILFDKSSAPTREPVVVIKEPDNNFRLLSITPPSGPRSVADYAEYIKITFNQPVSVETITIRSNPPINLVPYIADDPNTVIIVPVNEIWKPEVPYTVTIDKNLRSLDGKVYGRDIVYKYLNYPVTDVMVGEDFVEPEDEEVGE